MTTEDLERLTIRRQIVQEHLNDVEYRRALAVEEAEWAARPRVVLVDRERRVVRVRNAPQEALRKPAQTLSHGWADELNRVTSEPVGKFLARGGSRDLDYVLLRTRGGDNLLALVADEAMPTVVFRRFSAARTNLLVTFD